MDKKKQVEFAIRQHTECAKCGFPKWMHSIWAGPDARNKIKSKGCDVKEFKEPN